MEQIWKSRSSRERYCPGTTYLNVRTKACPSADDRKTLTEGTVRAKQVLQNYELANEELARIKDKINNIPADNDALHNIPMLVSLLRCHIDEEYVNVPPEKLYLVMSACLYFADRIPRETKSLLSVNYAGKANVVVACLEETKPELEKFHKWCISNKKAVDFWAWW